MNKPVSRTRKGAVDEALNPWPTGQDSPQLALSATSSTAVFRCRTQSIERKRRRF